ncbi:MAG: hypothetical protein AAGA57_08970 [Planctomycetota bacterium]
MAYEGFASLKPIHQRSALLGLAGFCLTVVSVFRFLESGNEPFMIVMSSFEPLVYVGFGCAMMVIWVHWSGWVTLLVIRRRASWAMLMGLPWAGFMCFLLWYAVTVYAGDSYRADNPHPSYVDPAERPEISAGTWRDLPAMTPSTLPAPPAEGDD